MSKEANNLPVNQIVCGDCLEVMRDWPDGCVDLVLTDPPYLAEYVHLYEGLAKQASRVLRDGGFVYSYIGTQFLPDIIELMRPYLTWFWQFNIKHNEGIPRFWAKKLMVTSKAVIVWTNGKPNLNKLRWTANDFDSERKSKEYHKWGQSIAFPIQTISLRTEIDNIVVDPFCGGGTTCVAAKMLGRNYIGIDISEEYCQIARERLEAVDTGVPVKEARQGQMAMFDEAGQ